MTSTVPSNSPNASVLEGVPGPLIPGTGHEARIGADAQAVTTRYWQYGEGMGSGSFPEGCYPCYSFTVSAATTTASKSSRTTC